MAEHMNASNMMNFNRQL